MVADNLGYVGPTSPMLGRPLFPNVSTSQPYNFRNGVSMLQLIEQLSQAGRELQDEWADYQLSAKEWANGIDDAWEQFQKDFSSQFADLKNNLEQLVQSNEWVIETVRPIIEDRIKLVFFGLTNDGYFCAFIPDGWDEIIFDTGANYADQDTYGKLMLSY